MLDHRHVTEPARTARRDSPSRELGATSVVPGPHDGPPAGPALTSDTPDQPASSPAVLWGARGVLALALVWTALQLLAQLDYVPIWDGRIYADCVVRAARAFSPGALRCAEHPSHVYVGLLAGVQRLAPGSFPLLLLANAGLLIGLAVAFAVLLRRTFPSSALAPERTLTLAALVVHPVVLANMVQPGLDFGVLVFSVAAMAAVVTGHRMLLVLFGIGAVFSKESGALLYAMLLAAYAGVFLLPRPIPTRLSVASVVAAITGAFVLWRLPTWKSAPLVSLAVGLAVFLALRPRDLPAEFRPRALWNRLRPLVPLALPLVLFAAYLGYRTTLPQQPVLWQGDTGSGSILRLLLKPHFRASVWNYLLLLLVLGFLWVPTSAVVLDAARGARRLLSRRPARPVPGADRDMVLFVTWLTVGAVYLLTRFITFANARYVLPVYPLMLVLTLAALLRLGMPRGWRLGGLAGVVALLALSVVRTVDPVSRALWGTFPVGEHDLLRMTSLSGECCGKGRDQLTYNLQFTAFDDLQRAALAQLQPVARGRTVGASYHGDWFTVGPLDAGSQRSLATTDAGQKTAFILDRPAGRTPPDTLSYLAFPYADHGYVLDSAQTSRGGGYAIVRADTTRADGYAMPVFLLVRRATTPRGNGG